LRCHAERDQIARRVHLPGWPRDAASREFLHPLEVADPGRWKHRPQTL